MKKLILFAILIYLFIPSFAVDNNWGEDSGVFTQGFEDQKAVSDSKLKHAIDYLKERNLSQKQRKMRREVQPLSPAYDSEYLKNFTDEKTAEDEFNNSLTVMIPMQAYSEDGTVIAPGFYKLSCRKISENKYVMDLSQGTQLVLTVEATPTNQDLGQESISFCNAEIIDNGRIRLMYGNLDLNLVSYIYFK
ncbi:hypothetical protein IJ182_03660 [bacterium]|nr:hypothetical protein [bacterium]